MSAPVRLALKDGGPAFPRPASEFTRNGTLPDGNDAEHAQSGMSLRDAFSIAALPEVVRIGWRERWSTQRVASECFSIADAMLAERAK